MISANNDALICDLAETYGIFDYRALPASLLATLVVGLRDDSRIKMFLSEEKATRREILMAAAVDRLSFLTWALTEDGANGVNRPASVLDAILGLKNEAGSNVKAFGSAADFEAEWKIATGVAHG